MTSAEGVGFLKLECPQGHSVGTILKQAPHQSPQFDPGAQASSREFWPQEDGQGRFVRHCESCGKSVGDLTSTLQGKLVELTFDMAETRAATTLPYV
jgi:hypothetical protein